MAKKQNKPVKEETLETILFNCRNSLRGRAAMTDKRVSSNLVGINFQYSLYIPFFASWKTITYKCWHV